MKQGLYWFKGFGLVGKHAISKAKQLPYSSAVSNKFMKCIRLDDREVLAILFSTYFISTSVKK